MSAQLRPRPDREPSSVMLLTLRVALIQPVIRPQAGRSEATEPKPRFVLLMRNLAFKQWGAVFPGAACVVALVDRFNQHCHRLTIDADSWRENHGLDAGDPPPARPASRRRRRPARST